MRGAPVAGPGPGLLGLPSATALCYRSPGIWLNREEDEGV